MNAFKLQWLNCNFRRQRCGLPGCTDYCKFHQIWMGVKFHVLHSNFSLMTLTENWSLYLLEHSKPGMLEKGYWSLVILLRNNQTYVNGDQGLWGLGEAAEEISEWFMGGWWAGQCETWDPLRSKNAPCQPRDARQSIPYQHNPEKLHLQSSHETPKQRQSQRHFCGERRPPSRSVPGMAVAAAG